MRNHSTAGHSLRELGKLSELIIDKYLKRVLFILEKVIYSTNN